MFLKNVVSWSALINIPNNTFWWGWTVEHPLTSAASGRGWGRVEIEKRRQTPILLFVDHFLFPPTSLAGRASWEWVLDARMKMDYYYRSNLVSYSAGHKLIETTVTTIHFVYFVTASIPKIWNHKSNWSVTVLTLFGLVLLLLFFFWGGGGGSCRGLYV